MTPLDTNVQALLLKDSPIPECMEQKLTGCTYVADGRSAETEPEGHVESSHEAHHSQLQGGVDSRVYESAGELETLAHGNVDVRKTAARTSASHSQIVQALRTLK